MIHVALVDARIDSEAQRAAIGDTGHGALVEFSGVVRSPDKGRDVLWLEYEAYQSVACEQMQGIAEDACERYGLLHANISHRLGTVRAGQTAFYVLVAAPHRQAAFLAAAEIVDRVKAEAAIWKQEVTRQGSEWVLSQSSDPASRSGERHE